MSNRSGLWLIRLLITLPIIILSLLFSAPVVAQDEGEPVELQHRAVSNVPDPPDDSYQVHQSMLRFVPGAEAPLHYPGGPGYITVLEGELTLYEDGVENVYQAGDGLIEAPDKLYKADNESDTDTVLMVTYLVPQGEDVTSVVEDPEVSELPEIGPETLAETTHEFNDPLDSFDLVQSTMHYEPGVPTEPVTVEGDTLLTIVAGTLEISVGDETVTVSQGDALALERNQTYTVQNTGDEPALTMSTELVPDVHSIVPAAGATVDRTFAIWLVVMTAAALLVVGGVLRLTGVRMR